MSDEQWKSAAAKQLVSYYLKRKPEALAGSQKHLQHPRFVAGMLLRTFGGMAYAKFASARNEIGANWPPKTGRLLRKALNAELRIDHGEVTCKYCLRTSGAQDNLLDWMTTQARAWWACPACTAEHALQDGAPVEEPN